MLGEQSMIDVYLFSCKARQGNFRRTKSERLRARAHCTSSSAAAAARGETTTTQRRSDRNQNNSDKRSTQKGLQTVNRGARFDPLPCVPVCVCVGYGWASAARDGNGCGFFSAMRAIIAQNDHAKFWTACVGARASNASIGVERCLQKATIGRPWLGPRARQKWRACPWSQSIAPPPP